MKEKSDNFFDNLGPMYTTVMHCGEKIWEKEDEEQLAQVYLYQGVKYALLWDKKTGENLRYTELENILKERETK